MVEKRDLCRRANIKNTFTKDNTTPVFFSLQPYLCESFYVLLEYARTAMFHWFFIEGLHLHNVLTIDLFPSHHVSVHR